MALLGVALAGGCTVYEIPTLSGTVGGATSGSNGFGGLHDSQGRSGSPADPNGGGGQPASLAVDPGQAGQAGQAGASDGDGDGDGSAGNGGTAGGSGGSESAGAGAAGRQGESQGGNGGAAPGAGGSVAGSTSCVAGWRNQSACEQCMTQVQPDLRACGVILDCYVSKSCGPSSCANADQKCGPNVLQEGAAAYAIAQEVYACLCK